MNRPVRLRIAQLLATPDGLLGGLEHHVLDLCQELATRHEVHLLADPGFAAACPDEVHFHAINFRRSRWNPLLYLAVLRCLRPLAPDIIHGHAGKPARLLAGLRRQFANSVCLATQHGEQKNLTPYMAMDAVIAVSPALATRYPEGFARTVPNGRRPPPRLSTLEREALRQRLGLHDRSPVLAAIGRLDPVKGFDLLLSALPGVDCQLLLVGEGPARADLSTLADTLGVGARVQFTGWRDDIPAVLQAADICVIPSRSEGFSLVALEALQAGTPVLGSRVGILPELLPAEWLAPPGDIGALAALLTRACARPDAVRAAEVDGFRLASSTLTLAAMADRTEAVYHELLAQRRHAPA